MHGILAPAMATVGSWLPRCVLDARDELRARVFYGRGRCRDTLWRGVPAGDEHPGAIPADIIFVVDEKPHPTFKREGNDLVYTHTLPLVESLCGTTVRLTTLDGRQLSVPVTCARCTQPPALQ
jgi:DnaJ-class molecular chaperone